MALATENRYDTFDVLKAILALGKRERIPNKYFHEAVLSLLENPRYKPLLNYPCRREGYSEDLELEIRDLMTSSQIDHTIGSDEILKNPKLIKNYEARTKQLFTEEEMSLLEEMAVDFENKIDELKRKK